MALPTIRYETLRGGLTPTRTPVGPGHPRHPDSPCGFPGFQGGCRERVHHAIGAGVAPVAHPLTRRCSARSRARTILFMLGRLNAYCDRPRMTRRLTLGSSPGTSFHSRVGCVSTCTRRRVAKDVSPPTWKGSAPPLNSEKRVVQRPNTSCAIPTG